MSYTEEIVSKRITHANSLDVVRLARWLGVKKPAATRHELLAQVARRMNAPEHPRLRAVI